MYPEQTIGNFLGQQFSTRQMIEQKRCKCGRNFLFFKEQIRGTNRQVLERIVGRKRG
jgi:hypothetical protein